MKDVVEKLDALSRLAENRDFDDLVKVLPSPRESCSACEADVLVKHVHFYACDENIVDPFEKLSKLVDIECFNCGSKEARLCCENCKAAFFCNLKCQFNGWEKHTNDGCHDEETRKHMAVIYEQYRDGMDVSPLGYNGKQQIIPRQVLLRRINGDPPRNLRITNASRDDYDRRSMNTSSGLQVTISSNEKKDDSNDNIDDSYERRITNKPVVPKVKVEEEIVNQLPTKKASTPSKDDYDRRSYNGSSNGYREVAIPSNEENNDDYNGSFDKPIIKKSTVKVVKVEEEVINQRTDTQVRKPSSGLRFNSPNTIKTENVTPAKVDLDDDFEKPVPTKKQVDEPTVKHVKSPESNTSSKHSSSKKTVSNDGDRPSTPQPTQVKEDIVKNDSFKANSPNPTLNNSTATNDVSSGKKSAITEKIKSISLRKMKKNPMDNMIYAELKEKEFQTIAVYQDEEYTDNFFVLSDTNQYVEVSEKCFQAAKGPQVEPDVGIFAVCENKDEGECYRVFITEIVSSSTSKVYYLDFGNYDDVSNKTLHIMPTCLLPDKIPALAVQCRLDRDHEGYEEARENLPDFIYTLPIIVTITSKVKDLYLVHYVPAPSE